MADLASLFEDTLKDLYYAEKQILKALPKMAKKAASPDLKKCFEDHRAMTETQVERLTSVFELLGKRAHGKKCLAIEGIIEEGSDLIEEHDKGPVLDAGLLAAAQAVEHYEIARYGSLLAWARVLGMEEAATLLEETLNEEKETDVRLTELAEAEVNEAAHSEEEGEDEDDAAEMQPPAERTAAQKKSGAPAMPTSKKRARA